MAGRVPSVLDLHCDVVDAHQSGLNSAEYERGEIASTAVAWAKDIRVIVPSRPSDLEFVVHLATQLFVVIPGNRGSTQRRRRKARR